MIAKSFANYVAGWKEGNEQKILASLTNGCIVIESHGPVYRGKAAVAEWIEHWFLGKGKVKQWDITHYYQANNQTAACEWIFEYSYQGKSNVIEGMSSIKFSGGKIKYIREYRTSKPLFEWQVPRKKR